ncbi:hypothetical protein HYPSUDRAFT_209831 [Hypholoma sublateritium FD-334 SS-4]|uniref:Uncharacterized protein n=1 Tax=Hypholoma sublateritium (strain FD-334 SS-4) TaxID=945553 RepID=A0A0D2N1L9_HYPSF|nr:hypothetical protein HYPSUDRAFT_209831 [Hypholoma sublateritium FD-334 SS-4]
MPKDKTTPNTPRNTSTPAYVRPSGRRNGSGSSNAVGRWQPSSPLAPRPETQCDESQPVDDSQIGETQTALDTAATGTTHVSDSDSDSMETYGKLNFDTSDIILQGIKTHLMNLSSSRKKDFTQSDKITQELIRYQERRVKEKELARSIQEKLARVRDVLAETTKDLGSLLAAIEYN